MAIIKEQEFYHFSTSGADDSLNIVINGDLEIHVSESVDGGYNLSFYKAIDQDKVSDNHDYDSDFIHGFWISPKSLKHEEE